MSNQYTVKRGDSLSSIAQKHGVTPGELLLANPQLSRDGRNPHLIYPGESLDVPNDGAFNQSTDLKRGTTSCPQSTSEVVKTKNIIFIGSEIHYDSFWWKMMFMAPGVVAAASGTLLRNADMTAIAYVPEGYTYLEKLAIDLVADAYGHKVMALSGSTDIVKAMNDLPVTKNNGCTERVKLQDVVFFGHGLPGRIALNYEGHDGDVDLTATNLASVAAGAFIPEGAIYSYACRTGNASWYDSDWFPFTSDAEALPEASLAQQMADRFGVRVHAFLTRTWYGNVLRSPADGATIASALKKARAGHENEVISLSSEHEALPHPGLAESGSGILGVGARGEGTNGFALWRRSGAREMPTGHDSPKGLSRTMRELKPNEQFKPHEPARGGGK